MAPTLPILVYHSISDDVSRRFRPYAVTPSRFTEHMTHLADLGYHGLTFADGARRLALGILPDRAVVLTFDDAFADFSEFALPALTAAGFVGTLFVPTAYVGATSAWLVHEGEAQRPILDWEHLVEVADAGIEVGAHSHTHPQLDRLRLRELRQELAKPKVLLEERLNQAVETVAYPFGFHNRRVRETARAAGYAAGCAVGNLTATNQFDHWAIPRQTVWHDSTCADLTRTLTTQDGRYGQCVSEVKRAIWRARRSFKRRERRPQSNGS